MQNFIIESAVYQEPKVLKMKPEKAIFKMVLQTADEVNQNKRLYPKKVLNNAMKQAEERIENRKFIGECDHPLLSQGGSQSYDGMRQTTVLLKEASHLVTSYEWKGNLLVGELETLRTPNGKLILGLLQDKITVGLSLRGMAELSKEDGINIVQDPLFTICYDFVSLPSHKSSVVNFNEMRFENTSLLTESCGTVCYNGVCYLAEYFDKLVDTKVIKFFNRWI
jgi:hypothetical protein